MGSGRDSVMDRRLVGDVEYLKVTIFSTMTGGKKSFDSS